MVLSLFRDLGGIFGKLWVVLATTYTLASLLFAMMPASIELGWVSAPPPPAAGIRGRDAFNTYYATLGLPADATLRQVHVAYLRSAQGNDCGGGLHGHEEEEMLELSIAHRLLSDSVSRCAYDTYRGLRSRLACAALDAWALTPLGWPAREAEIRAAHAVLREGMVGSGDLRVAGRETTEAWVDEVMGHHQPGWFAVELGSVLGMLWDKWGRRAGMWCVVASLLAWKVANILPGYVFALLVALWMVFDVGVTNVSAFVGLF